MTSKKHRQTYIQVNLQATSDILLLSLLPPTPITPHYSVMAASMKRHSEFSLLRLIQMYGFEYTVWSEMVEK